MHVTFAVLSLSVQHERRVEVLISHTKTSVLAGTIAWPAPALLVEFERELVEGDQTQFEVEEVIWPKVEEGSNFLGALVEN